MPRVDPSTSGSFRLSSFLSTKVPKPWKEECGTDVIFQTEQSAVSYFLHVEQFWVFVLTFVGRELSRNKMNKENESLHRPRNVLRTKMVAYFVFDGLL